MKKISIFGFTGSIGSQALDIIEQKPENFEIDVFVCNKNADKAISLINLHKPKNVFIFNPNARLKISEKCSKDINFFRSYQDLREHIKVNKSDIYLSAISSFECLDLTLDAAKSGGKLLLANKESLVVFGNSIISECEANNTELIPIDSEHFSLFTALKNIERNNISRIFLTASGGPFRGLSMKEVFNKSVEEALNHPNWNMGSKITIDSATLVNKCFELIEAQHLFSLKPDLLNIIVQKQSVIHSLVELKDGSVEAQMSKPSMIIPLAYGLLGEHSEEIKKIYSLDLFDEDIELSIEAFPSDRKNLLEIAYDVMRNDDNSGLIFATLNDIAVKRFLQKKIKFGEIYKLIFDNYHLIERKKINSLEDLNDNKEEINNFIEGK
ncbi:MAG: 1-deoxy-D-xylulose 5-phosphate reductoisomerase [Gammaproteobacteria bacterium]|nr:1-deoxy-D-xylulose 5-phosphate reductoisomerase [Gammaproteobacteria bacterium]|tara:strand:+ start:2162 stop:3307 length:1146 start_codon:yes stop_codon:yes gene_type:complete